MPVYNIVKRRTDWAEYTITANSYEEAIEIAENTPVEYAQVEYDEWEIDEELSGTLATK